MLRTVALDMPWCIGIEVRGRGGGSSLALRSEGRSLGKGGGGGVGCVQHRLSPNWLVQYTDMHWICPAGCS